MAKICSMHQRFDPSCKLCNTDVRDLLPDYDRKMAEAKAAGTHVCEECEFHYYKTVDLCPLCGTSRKSK